MADVKPATDKRSEWSKHRAALRHFVENETSLGCYGSGRTLEKARAAMHYFARGDSLGKLLADLDAAEARADAAEERASEYGPELACAETVAREQGERIAELEAKVERLTRERDEHEANNVCTPKDSP